MNNLREVKDDIFKDWIEFREETLSSMSEEDKKHFIYFEEISKRILNSIPNKNRKYVQKQLEMLALLKCNFYTLRYGNCTLNYLFM
jgi:hypothetical protein